MTTHQKALTTNNLAMLFYGLSAVLVGPTLPGMIASFDLSLSQGGLIGSAQNAGGFLGALLSLWIADRLSHSWSALGSFVLLGGALIVVGVAGTYAAILIAFALTGVFIRVLDVMLNAYTGDLTRGKSGRPMSILHMFFSIGAFVGPMIARAIMSAGVDWAHVYRYVGLAYVVVVIAGSRPLRSYVSIGVSAEPSGVDSKDEAEPVPRSRVTGRALVSLFLLAGTLLFYAFHQVGINSWIPYFLETSRGAGADVASLGLSLYWVGIIAGRFLTSRFVERTGPWRVLIAGCVVSAGATIGAVLVPSVPIAHALLVTAGITSGATIPLAYSVGYTILPSRTGSVTAFLSIAMLIGRVLSPWVIGTLAEASTLVAAMTVPGLSLFVSALLVGMVRLRRS